MNGSLDISRFDVLKHMCVLSSNDGESFSTLFRLQYDMRRVIVTVVNNTDMCFVLAFSFDVVCDTNALRSELSKLTNVSLSLSKRPEKYKEVFLLALILIAQYFVQQGN